MAGTVTAGGPNARSALLATAASLAVDGVTAEVVRDFRAAGVSCMLIKGPSVAEWLYDDGSARYYMDSDLWVPTVSFAVAEARLAALGFRPAPPAVSHPPGTRAHADPWVRVRDGAHVDLHRALSGVGIAPEEAWALLSPETILANVGGESVAVPPIAVRALLVALHAAQHGPEKVKPIEDLHRALAKLDDAGWREAAAVAARLDATPGLSYGLRLLPDGQRLAERLGLVSSELVEQATRRGSSARVALGLQRLAQTPDLRGRLRLVRREFVPSREFLQWWSPLARRGTVGLALAYVWRPLWLLWHLVPSLLAVNRDRRAGQRLRRPV